MSPEEDWIKTAFRDYMETELKRPEVQEAKKKLIKTYTEGPGPFATLTSPFWWVPALGLVGLLILVPRLANSPQTKQEAFLPAVQTSLEGNAVEKMADQASGQKELLPETSSHASSLEEPAVINKKPRVIVKRVSSKVGPTMIYQKNYRNHPVTIVWVFAGGKNA